MIIPLRISGGSQVMLILKKEEDDDVMTTGPGAGGRQNDVCYNVTVHAKIKYKSAKKYFKS